MDSKLYDLMEKMGCKMSTRQDLQHTKGYENENIDFIITLTKLDDRFDRDVQTLETDLFRFVVFDELLL